MAPVKPVAPQERAEPEYLTTEEVARLCRVTPATVRWRRHVGIGPHGVRVGGRRVLYRASEVRDWIESQFEQDVPA